MNGVAGKKIHLRVESIIFKALFGSVWSSMLIPHAYEACSNGGIGE